MATKYCRINEAPEEARSDTLVINLPNFKEEIIKARRSRGRQKVLTINYLRAIFTEIGATYDPTFNAFLDVNLTRYKGISAIDEDEVALRIMEIIEAVKPDLIYKAIAKKISNRGSKVKLIYFVAPDFKYCDVFTHNGIDSITLEEVDDFLGIKKKKNKKDSFEE